MSKFEADERGAKKRDYWFTVLLTDPVAVPISNFLAKRRWLTPDQVTILSLILGVSVGALFATGERWGLIAGGLTFYAAFIVDCVDGKLARALGVTSARGEHLDALADGARRASASLGLGILLWGKDPILWVLIYVVLAYYFLEISGAEKGQSGSGLGGKWSRALAKRRLLPNPGMPDVQAIVFVFGPITGFVVPALWVGIAMVALAILMTIRRRLRVPAS